MTAWMDVANGHVGLKEAPGAANNPKIVAFYKASGHPEIKADAVPWCAAFVGACLAEAGLPNSGSLAARSYLKYGVALDAPRKGCIVVITRGNPKSWEGHVGFLVKATATHVHLLGGNQANAVNVAAFPRSKVLGYRWPVEATIRDLKEAGSTEANAIDVSEKVTVGTLATSAALEAANETGALEPSVPDIAKDVDTLATVLESAKSVGKALAGGISISTFLVLIAAGVGLYLWRRSRLARHRAGQPISTQV